MDIEKVWDQLRVEGNLDDEGINSTIALMIPCNSRLYRIKKPQLPSFFSFVELISWTTLWKRDSSLVMSLFAQTVYSIGLTTSIYLSTIKFCPHSYCK